MYTCSNIITDVISKVRELPTLVRELPQIADRNWLRPTEREIELFIFPKPKLLPRPPPPAVSQRDIESMSFVIYELPFDNLPFRTLFPG